MNANAPHDAIDSTIDRALSALRDAQPRSGLEGRILASLEHRGTTQPSGFHITAHLALWTAASAAVLAVASLIVLHRESVIPNRQTSKTSVILSEARTGSPASLLAGADSAKSKNPETARPATNAEPFSTTNLARVESPRTSTEPTASNHRHPERSVAQRRTSVFEDAQITSSPNGASTTPTDAQALADLHSPSHPAPPLPLTQQEKLFLRMLRYGDATQLAELDPMVRAKQDADETAAFKAFFPDPPPLQQPNGDTE